MCQQLETQSRNQSATKVKSINSVSFMSNIPMLKIMNSKTKKVSTTQNESKIRSVSRSFSRRKHQTNPTVIAETGSNNTSHIAFNLRHPQKETSTHLLTSKIRQANAQAAYFGHLHQNPSKARGQESSVGHDPRSHSQQASDMTEEIIEMNRIYSSKNYSEVIQLGAEYKASNRTLETNVNYHFLIGMSQYKLEDFEKAKASFELLLNLKPNYKRTVYLFLAICWNNLKQFQMAADVLAKGMEIFPRCYEAKLYFAKMLLKLHRYDEAIQIYRSTAELSAANHKTPSFIGLGDCYRHKKLYQQALDNYQTALTLYPPQSTSTEILLKSIYCFFELKELSNATLNINRVIFGSNFFRSSNSIRRIARLSSGKRKSLRSKQSTKRQLNYTSKPSRSTSLSAPP